MTFVLFSDPKLNHSMRVNEGQLMTNALNAFLIFVSKKGLVYCASEDVYDHLGLRQVCMAHQGVTVTGTASSHHAGVLLPHSFNCVLMRGSWQN